MVSIIVPIYNVAPYIEQCLNSVINQTYKDLEVLIVDDCGNDDSMSIVERIVKSYQGQIQFKVLHHEHNRGLSAARNTGISVATGEFLFFLDSDDSISLNCIELLLLAIGQSNDNQMAVGDVEVIGADWEMLRLKSGIYKTNLQQLYFNCRYFIPVWNKLIKTSFLKEHNLLFEEGLIHEDYLWSFKVSCHLKQLAVINEKTYRYIRREGSLDNLPNRELHNLHYSYAISLQADYALKEMHYYTRRSVFEYVERAWYSKYKDALDFGKSRGIAWKNYLLLRKTPQWNPIVLIYRKCSKGCILRTLHKLFPSKLGFKYYNYVIRKYGY